MKKIKILYVIGGVMSRGGIEAYVLNNFRYIDRKIFKIDFVIHGFDEGVYDQEILKCGGKIFNVPVKSKDYFGNKKELERILKEEKYDIIHSHMDAMNMLVLKIAKKCGVKIRIAHSHNTQHLTNNKIKYFINEYAKKNIHKYATNYFACSKEAAIWLFGDEMYKNGEVVISKNAIELEKYKYNEYECNKIKNQLNIKDNIVIGNVGRFDYQKNHIFLLELIAQCLKYLPNIKLILIGEGRLRKEIEIKINELDMQKNVVLLGSKSNVNEYMNSFDLFILPSKFEGLGIVLVEAQANGLNCLTSDMVPKEVNITGDVEFLSLNNKEEWINRIINKNYNKQRNITSLDKLRKDGYDINQEIKKIEKIYLNLVRG